MTHPFRISHFKQLKCKSAAQTITLRVFICKNLITIQSMYQSNCRLLFTTLMTTGLRDAPELTTCSDTLSFWTVQYHLASPWSDKPLLTSPEFAQVQMLSYCPGLMNCCSGKHQQKSEFSVIIYSPMLPTWSLHLWYISKDSFVLQLLLQKPKMLSELKCKFKMQIKVT